MTRADADAIQLTPGRSITVKITATGPKSLWDLFCITCCGKPNPDPTTCKVGYIRMKGNHIAKGESNVPLASSHTESNAYIIAGKSYYQLCIEVEQCLTLWSDDLWGGKCVKSLFVFSGWGHLLTDYGRNKWFDVLERVFAFIKVSFGVWTPDDFEKYFDLQNRFKIFDHQNEVYVVTMSRFLYCNHYY